MSIHYGQLNESKVDLSAIEKRLKAVETLSAANKTTLTGYNSVILNNVSLIGINKADIASNKTNITTNKTDIGTNKTKADSAYNKAVSNGDKLLKKVSAMQTFAFHFTNPSAASADSFTDPEETIRGYPQAWKPFLNRNLEIYVHLQTQYFDGDVLLVGTEKAEYQVTFTDTSGSLHSWTSPTQTQTKLSNFAFVVDVKLHVSAQFSNWNDFRFFRVSYKAISPSRVSGNESVLHVWVYSA